MAEDTREVVDIMELNKSIKEIVARQSSLRANIDKIVEDLEGADR
jgi:type I restriction enzyme M protein